MLVNTDTGGERGKAFLTLVRGHRAVLVLRCGRGVLHCGCQSGRPACITHVITIIITTTTIAIVVIIITVISKFTTIIMINSVVVLIVIVDATLVIGITRISITLLPLL